MNLNQAAIDALHKAASNARTAKVERHGGVG